MALRYLAYDQLGTRVEGVVDTDSEQAAYAALQREGLIAFRFTRIRPRRSLVELAPSLFRPGRQDLIDFTRGLSTLLKSGIPLRESLATLGGQSRSPGLRLAVKRTISAIEGGSRFSDACSQSPDVFPDLFVRMIRVGEATGEMAKTTERVASMLGRRKATRDRVKAALIYPALSLVAAGIAAFILVTYSLPSLVNLLGDLDSQLPATTRALIAISDFLQTYKVRVAIGLAVAVVAGFVTIRTARGRFLRDLVLTRLPFVGSVLVKSNMFGLTSTLSTLLEAGIPPVEALELSREGLGNQVMRNDLARVIDEVTAGTRLGQAFASRPSFPSILAQGIATGEAAGSLPATLVALSEYFENETERSVSGATELIQPAVIALVAGVVGFVAVAVVTGIYSSLGAIK